MACVDSQLHQNELFFLQSLRNDLNINDASQAASELILAQADNHLGLDETIKNITPVQYSKAFSLAARMAFYDGFLDQTERKLLKRLKTQWQINDEAYEEALSLAEKKALSALAALKSETSVSVSTAAKIFSGVEAVLGQTVVDVVIGTLGTTSLKERVKDYRIEALLSGPKYEKAISECREVGLKDIKIADTCLQATAQSLQKIGQTLNDEVNKIETRIGNRPAQNARAALKSMKDDHAEIERLVNQELKQFQELQVKKRRAMKFYTIAFMGRSKAGKSTLHAVVTGGGWDQIGVGRQNTTRLNRVYEWHNIRIIDTPGIATPGGEELEKVARSIIDEADLICFVATNNNQQTSEFEFLKQLRCKGKPLLVLLNVKEDLSHPVRLKRFLEKPEQAFSDDKKHLGGHIDRIRRDAAQHYGTSNFPIIPVQLLAAQIAQQQPEHEHASVLMKASRIQDFLDSVRLSLLNEGLLRRSQNLLGSTVADIERPCMLLQQRAKFYTRFSQQVSDRAKDCKARLTEATNIHLSELKQEIKNIFEDIRSRVPEFAENHWDQDENKLNDQWLDTVKDVDVEKRLQQAQEKAFKAFYDDMKDILDEVGKELNLTRNLLMGNNRLSEQDSTAWAYQLTKWGGSILALVSAFIINTPFGWVVAGVGFVLGILSKLFESQESKQRKAIVKMTNALNSQINKQQENVISSTKKQFENHSSSCADSIEEYFKLSASGLAFVGKALARSAEKLDIQSSILNTHFAARVLDFAKQSPSEISAQAIRERIHAVCRSVGESMDISLSQKIKLPKDLSHIESVIQEKISVQQIESQK